MLSLRKFGQNPPIGSLHRLQEKLIFTVLIMWWPGKLGQGHQNLIKSFNYPNDTIHEACSESIIRFKRWGVGKLFFGHSKCWCDFENQAKVTQSNQFFPLPQWCFCASLVKIHQLVQTIILKSADKAHFYSLNSVVTLKIRLWSNVIKSFNYPNETIYKVWPESIFGSKR